MFYGYGRRKKAIEERPGKKRRNIPINRFVRVSVQLQARDTGRVIAGRVFLSDLNSNEVTLFLNEPIMRDTEVFVVIEHPKHLFLRGKVAWCTLYQFNMRVLSVESYKYRGRVRFQYDSESERSLVQDYFKALFE